MTVHLFTAKGGQGVTTTALGIAVGLGVSVAHHDDTSLGDPGAASYGVHAYGTRAGIVDHGVADPADFDAQVQPGDMVVLFTKRCYLALRAAAAVNGPFDAVLVLDEPGRSLDDAAIHSALGTPVIAHVPYSMSVARMADCGIWRHHDAFTQAAQRLDGAAWNQLVPA